ncbi:nicotinamide riboside transporter PnuC [Flavobacterium urocaniciphilum]|uniref:Nicotinamide riboside transporter PnuC n=1 Tax=Flavobacterium urocaniciphilum TaxID=1299341 RepID=A0A1H9CEY6_9FLAO|nr:nicotinamide riboside transporter PnuC [Flavobacterium urocaniciphilum]SEP99765.1 nicotinamide mononucleotide transporter [Flavobacterium urocaniciphilum]
MFETIINQYKNIPNWQISIEIIVFIFGILSVYFAKKENILVYPTGLIATILSVYIMYYAKYYADMSINIYYTIMSFYGWYVWKKGENSEPLSITRTNLMEKIIGFILFIITAFVCVLIYKFFDYKIQFNNYLDIFTTSLFFTAMWYMAKKKLENWTLWIIGDALVVYIFFDRQLYIIAFQYIIFTILAISAYIEWKKYLAK